MDVLSQPVLVLNSGYMPVGIKSVRDAICMVLMEKADIIKEAANLFIRSEKLKLPAPRIILLINYNHLPKRKIRLSRQNILIRDNHTCSYCAKQLSASKLTLDHIIPKSRWAEIQKDRKATDFNSWENIVTACKECNTKKGSKLLSELKWKLPPIKKLDPRLTPLLFVSNKTAEEFGWNEYLFYNQY
ncbi:MAG: HNH endonuclease [Leptospira sp.]|nr:HNH endonuclease [Leptospira sp.]